MIKMRISYINIIILFLITLLYNCSGCSKSGRHNNEIDLRSTVENKEKSESKVNIIDTFKFHKNESLYGRVVEVIDGDTYDALIDDKIIRVRLSDIDAPESGMPFYEAATNYLEKLCFNREVRIQFTGEKTFQRYVAKTYLENNNLSYEMIKAGWAWYYEEYSSDSKLKELEIKARNSKIGLWRDDDPMPPWSNRRYHKNGISTKDSFNITYDRK